MTRPRLLSNAAALVLVVAAAAAARADVPSPTTSEVDPVLACCPAGDLVFHVTSRKLSGKPAPSSTVALEFCGAVGWHWDATDQPSDLIMVGGPPACVVRRIADALGRAPVALKAGGTTGVDPISVYADGVLLGTRTLVSPDQNGDLIVTAADEAILATKLGTPDPSADFDGDGLVTETDRALLRQHLGHASARPVPARPGSWGSVKLDRR